MNGQLVEILQFPQLHINNVFVHRLEHQLHVVNGRIQSLQELIKQFFNGFHRVIGKRVGQAYPGGLQLIEQLFVVDTVNLDAKRPGLIHRAIAIAQIGQLLDNAPQLYSIFAIVRSFQDRPDQNLQ